MFCGCEDQVWYIWEIQNVVGLVEHPNVVWIGWWILGCVDEDKCMGTLA
jgi:hypothetical protein